MLKLVYVCTKPSIIVVYLHYEVTENFIRSTENVGKGSISKRQHPAPQKSCAHGHEIVMERKKSHKWLIKKPTYNMWTHFNIDIPDIMMLMAI